MNFEIQQIISELILLKNVAICVVQIKIRRTGKLAFHNFEVRAKLILEFKRLQFVFQY